MSARAILMTKTNKKLASLVEYFAESASACLVTMVQGNLLALTVGHLVIASQTGIISGAIATVALMFAHTGTRWVVSVVLGIATTVADYFVHPGQFGPVIAVALMTGLGAMILSYVFGTALRFIGAQFSRKSKDELPL
jgi:hypothetical protein